MEMIFVRIPTLLDNFHTNKFSCSCLSFDPIKGTCIKKVQKKHLQMSVKIPILNVHFGIWSAFHFSRSNVKSPAPNPLTSLRFLVSFFGDCSEAHLAKARRTQTEESDRCNCIRCSREWGKGAMTYMEKMYRDSFKIFIPHPEWTGHRAS